MQITLSFDSFEEFQTEINKYAARLKPKKPDLVPVEDVVEAIKEQEKAEKPAPAPKPEAEAPAADEKPAVDESYRLEVRRTLSKLNKMEGHKGEAIALIKTFGVSRLDDVALNDLPALMQKAEEAINA